MGSREQGAGLTEGRWLTIPRTLCFVLNGDSVLLMKRGAHKRVFPNRYNGVGGHIERDEDPLTSAVREVEEETGLRVHNMRLRAVYNVDAGDPTGIMVLVFTAWSDSRAVVPNEEGTLHWVARDQVQTLDLVDDLPEMLPRILAMPDDAPPLFVHLSYDAQDRVRLRITPEIRT